MNYSPDVTAVIPAEVEGLLGYAAVMYLKTEAEILPRNGGKGGRWRQNGQG